MARLPLVLLLLMAPLAAQPASRDVRRELDQRHRERAKRSLLLAREAAEGSGWELEPRRGLVLLRPAVIPHSRTVDHVVTMAQGLLRWCVPAFTLRARPRPGTPVLRLCESSEERRRLLDGQPDRYDATTGHVILPLSLGSGSVLGPALLRQHVEQQCPGLFGLLPEWLRRGALAHLATAHFGKRHGFVFRFPTRPFRTCVRLLKRNEMLRLEDLVGRPFDELATLQKHSTAERAAVCHLFVRFLVPASGRPGRAGRELVTGVLRSLSDRLREIQEREWTTTLEDAGRAQKPLEGEARDAAYESLLLRMRTWARRHPEDAARLRAEARAEALGHWKTRDWNRLQNSFESSLR